MVPRTPGDFGRKLSKAAEQVSASFATGPSSQVSSMLYTCQEQPPTPGACHSADIHSVLAALSLVLWLSEQVSLSLGGLPQSRDTWIGAP